jgi:N-acetyl sugar amidotransferase
MKYCNRCIIPETRPNIKIDSTGICNACQTHATKPQIDWARREKAFREVVKNSKSRAKNYDCVIPVSGGKDSTWQVVKCLEFGLHPLAVTWKTPARTPVGARNLANLINLGVDHIDFQINPNVEKKFMLEAFRRHGSTAIPMHMAIYNIPRKIALAYDIPLVVWGENGAFEYGCEESEVEGFVMDRKWMEKHGVTHDLTVADYASDKLTLQELTPYFAPDEKELEAKATSSIFLGYYFPWDPEMTFRVAREHGFESEKSGARVGFYNYADIDDDFVSIHHYLKWYKFGFTRLFDNLSLEIRNGRLSRNAAIDIVKKTGPQKPLKDIESFCEFVDISLSEFWKIAETFRNHKIWAKGRGHWQLEEFLIPDWDWTGETDGH